MNSLEAILTSPRFLKMILFIYFFAAFWGFNNANAAGNWTEVSAVLDSVDPVVNGNMTIKNEFGRDAMLLGNGDIGVAAVSNSSQIEYYLSCNEFPGRVGRILVQRNGGSGTSSGISRHEQNMKNAEVLIDARISDTYLETEAYIPYLITDHKNIFIVKITNRDSASVPLKFILENFGGTADTGVNGNIAWATRSIGDTGDKKFNWRVAFSANIIGEATNISATRNSGTQSQLSCNLAPGDTLEFIVNLEAESGLSDLMPTINSLRDLAVGKSGTSTDTSAWHTAHLAWWQDYWTKSYI